MKINLQHVHYMPKELEPGILYVSEEFGTAAHLCACGCGAKIRTPLGPTEWKLKEKNGQPSLYPSVGSWQQECRSHYWIKNGDIIWGDQWTPEEIKAGRRKEVSRRQQYYEVLDRQRGGALQKLWKRVKNLLRR